jgi:hypothetical protein
MWKQLTAGILLLAFITSSFCNAFIVFDYYGNTASYAKNCVNKNLPKLHCNGKCQMMKKLQQEEKKDKNNSDRKGENKIEVISSKSFFVAILPKSVSLHRIYGVFKDGIAKDQAYSLLRPPSLS